MKKEELAAWLEANPLRKAIGAALDPYTIGDGSRDAFAAAVGDVVHALGAPRAALPEDEQAPSAAVPADYAEAMPDTFCDAFCTWRGHHPECERAALPEPLCALVCDGNTGDWVESQNGEGIRVYLEDDLIEAGMRRRT